MKSTITQSIKAGLKSLSFSQAHFAASALKAEKFFGMAEDEKFSEFEDFAAADFLSAGFGSEESDALVFLIAEGCDSFEEMDRWIYAHKAAIGVL